MQRQIVLSEEEYNDLINKANSHEPSEGLVEISKHELDRLNACEYTLYSFLDPKIKCPKCGRAMLISGYVCPSCGFDPSDLHLDDYDD